MLRPRSLAAVLAAAALGALAGCEERNAPCGDTDDCAGDEICVAGFCRRLCRSNGDCESWAVCIEGVCRTACNTDQECGRQEQCENGACLPAEAQADAGITDTGVASDHSQGDAALPDLVADDARAADTAPVDTGAADAARPDAAVVDAAAPDLSAPDLTEPDSAVPCHDLDGDGHYAHDPVLCPPADDHCDDKVGAWSEESCATCVDTDGDSYWSGCQSYEGLAGEDCAEGDAARFRLLILYTDIDGDGLGAGSGSVQCTGVFVPDGYAVVGGDCDHNLPTCTVDCTTNSDADVSAVADCVEIYCGSDPLDSESSCYVASSPAELDAAITAANNDGTDSWVLLYDLTLTTEPQSILSDGALTVRQAPGTQIQVLGDLSQLFKVEGEHVTFEGLHIVNVGGLRRTFQIKAASATLAHSIVEGYGTSAVLVENADYTRVFDNIIVGGTASPGSDSAAVVVRRGNGAVIAGNLIAQSSHDGIQIRGVRGLVLDHNTVADHARTGIQFDDLDAIEQVCMRNNIIAGSAGAALDFQQPVVWDEGTLCTAPLDPDGDGFVEYGNGAWGNQLLCSTHCSGIDETSCASCLPAQGSLFFEFRDDPAFANTAAGHTGFYCPTALALIDNGDDLGYDLNGAEPGSFNGSGPDIGGRETGGPACEGP